VGDVDEEDNLIDDTIPRSFIREGSGGFSGPHLASANFSRAAALRGADCPSFLPVALPDPGICGTGGALRGQFLASNFNLSRADFVDDAGRSTSSASEQDSMGDSELDEHEASGGSGDSDALLTTFDAARASSNTPALVSGPARKPGGARYSVFGAAGQAQVDDEGNDGQAEEEAEEMARQIALEEAELDMDHVKGLIRRGHNITGSGAELAELLGIESLSHSSEEAQAPEPAALSAGSPQHDHANVTPRSVCSRPVALLDALDAARSSILPAALAACPCSCPRLAFSSPIG